VSSRQRKKMGLRSEDVVEGARGAAEAPMHLQCIACIHFSAECVWVSLAAALRKEQTIK